jgi:hypothetical protein
VTDGDDTQAPKAPKPATRKGRKSTLTIEKVDRVCNFIKLGHYAQTACNLAGIKERTWYNWISAAEKRKRPNKAQVHLLQSIAYADAQYEHVLVSRIAQDKSAKTAMEMLSRRFPDRWAPQQKNVNRNVDKHGDDVPAGVLVVPGQMNEDEWVEAAKRYKEHQPTAEEAADADSGDSVH